MTTLTETEERFEKACNVESMNALDAVMIRQAIKVWIENDADKGRPWSDESHMIDTYNKVSEMFMLDTLKSK